MGYSAADLEWLTTGELNAMAGGPGDDEDEDEPDDSAPTLAL